MIGRSLATSSNSVEASMLAITAPHQRLQTSHTVPGCARDPDPASALKGGESVVTDAGSAFYVLGQAFRCKGNQRYIVSGAMGALGL